MAAPGSPFLEQVQLLEQKLRHAQRVTAVPFFDHDEDGSPAAAARGEAAQKAEKAVEEAVKLREQMQRALDARVEMQARENEGLSQKVQGLDQSLRVAEAARRREVAQRERELAEMRDQLDWERQVRDQLETERHMRDALDNERIRRHGLDTIVRSASPPPGTPGSARVAHLDRLERVAGAIEARSSEREWHLRAELAEAANEAQSAWQSAQAKSGSGMRPIRTSTHTLVTRLGI